ncbi:hypothetical protein DWB77_04821 [Streptomyces hundungensis]|uniref:Uncharacterized protein n=2 Tax=Streptomyces hundungensis TaxID=1077946 RepID=A0A387HP13_9ACTN|nr:hypothetical protein DWB77_04821 [Streptomyces hundungensis]
MLPSWTDENIGTMKRAGLWLVTVIGEGSVFTKDELRQAFPGVSQIDRRMRDLRDHGWQIHTNREDVSLEPYEQRFVRQGEAVWEPGKGRTKAAAPITATQRREIMARDGNFCRSCGISGGESYAGTYEAAQLDIARRQVRQDDGTSKVELVTECNRCRVGGRQLTADPADVLTGVRQLGRLERRVLAGWVADDRRPFSPVERLWAEYRSLPEESRHKIRQALDAEGAD